ncbi:MAG: STAS domain-containing protein [Colwellia sp.]
MSTFNLSIDNNEAALTGELTRQTIAAIDPKLVKKLLAQERIVLSLKDISKIDTAGLAWLFELLEKAQTQQCALTFSALPSKLNKLITLSGVEGFLPVASE